MKQDVKWQAQVGKHDHWQFTFTHLPLVNYFAVKITNIILFVRTKPIIFISRGWREFSDLSRSSYASIIIIQQLSILDFNSVFEMVDNYLLNLCSKWSVSKHQLIKKKFKKGFQSYIWTSFKFYVTLNLFLTEDKMFQLKFALKFSFTCTSGFYSVLV